MTDKRLAILRAATAVVAKRGIRGLRMEDVAGEADVAASLIYYHYRSREGLIDATLDRANERVSRKLQAADDGVRSGRAVVEVLLLSEFDDDDPDLRQIAVVWGEATASAVFDPRMRDKMQAATDAWISLVADGVERGIDDGSIASTVHSRSAAARLTALVLGLTARWLTGMQSSPDARELLRHAVSAEFGLPAEHDDVHADDERTSVRPGPR